MHTGAQHPALTGQVDALLATWPVGRFGVVALDRSGPVLAAGDVDGVHPWASVSKVITALTVLRAAEQGVVALEDAAGPPGATLRDLLAHASGLALDDDRVLAAPRRRRIYSNRGVEVAAAHVADRAGRPFAELATTLVLAPLGMSRTEPTGSPAHGTRGPVADLARLAAELLSPQVLGADLVSMASTVTHPGLAGVLPGFGRQGPNDWGLGPEVRGRKSPHWTGTRGSAATFGHFGQSGSFLWVDPEAGLACAGAGDTPFGPWAAEAWPPLADLLLDHLSG